jgi:hypothetical protein
MDIIKSKLAKEIAHEGVLNEVFKAAPHLLNFLSLR